MDKDKILERYNPKDIYLKFLGLHKFPNCNISSPFSEDKNPSFRLYENDTFKCFSSGKQGDVFEFVANLHHLDCKADFASVIEIIANEFEILDSAKGFKYQKKAFESPHFDYWKQGNWNVTAEILKKYEIEALKGFEFYNHSKGQIQKIDLFTGSIGFVYKVNHRAEIYIPKQTKNKKFFFNNLKPEDIFGFDQIESKVDRLIICAGKKDCLILNANGFAAVSFRSENHFIKDEQIALLKTKAKKLFICYDNDESGQKAMERAIKEHHLIALYLPKEFNDVADYFLSYSRDDFSKILLEADEIKKTTDFKDKTPFSIVEDYLSQFYKFRYNTISLDIEYCKKGFYSWKSVNENTLFRELEKKRIKISMNGLIVILKSDFVEEFNPIKEYFKSLPKWDQKTDYIETLANYVNPIEREQFNYHFKKWLVRTVKCSLKEGYFNKQAFILVDKKQSSGKTTFCEFLCPPELKSYFTDDISDDKDGKIALCKSFLINLDELTKLSKVEINAFKSMISCTQVNQRLPYDRKNSVLPRIASFIGSTNEGKFLIDQTGSVRWLCFQIDGINWRYFHEFNIRNLWAQAYHLAHCNFDCEFSKEDIIENEIRNKKFQQSSFEQGLITKYIKKSDKENGEFLTSSEITLYLSKLGVKINYIQIGRALSALDFERLKDAKKQVYGYYVKKLPL